MNVKHLFLATVGTIVMACGGKDEQNSAQLDESLLNHTNADIEYLTKGHPADHLYDVQMTQEEDNKQTYGILRFRDVNKDRKLSANEFQGAVFMEKTQKKNTLKKREDRFKKFEIVFEPGIVEDHLERIKEQDPYDYNDSKRAMKETLESITGRESWMNNGLRPDEFRYLTPEETEIRVEKGTQLVQDTFFTAEKKKSFAAKMKSMFLNQREPESSDTTTVQLNPKPWELIP